MTIDAKWGVNSRAVQDYAYITNPAQFYELHYSALKNYYVNSGMSVGEAHLRANTNLTANANDGGLGYMVYTVPSGQEFIGINGKSIPLRLSAAVSSMRARSTTSVPTTGPMRLSARPCVRSTTLRSPARPGTPRSTDRSAI